MTGNVPYRANCDALRQFKHKLRKEAAEPTTKGLQFRRTMEHLTTLDAERDQYRYYHATKGWRTRRARGKTDAELTAHP